MTLTVVPISFKQACEFIDLHHRHHRPPQGHKFSVGLCRDGELCAVATVGRPVARGNDDGLTAEVTRLATDGTPNACSKLYSACRRICSAMGYKRVITYVLDSERGSSLAASNWALVGVRGGGSWSCKSRPRSDKHPTQKKMLWEAVA